MGVRRSPHSSHDNALTRARIRKNMTLQEAADAVGCTLWTMTQYERNGYVYNLEWARKLAKLYDVPIRDLIGNVVLTAKEVLV